MGGVRGLARHEWPVARHVDRQKKIILLYSNHFYVYKNKQDTQNVLVFNIMSDVFRNAELASVTMNVLNKSKFCNPINSLHSLYVIKK